MRPVYSGFPASRPNSAASINQGLRLQLLIKHLAQRASRDALYCTVPFRKTVCGLLLALSLTTILAVSLVPLGADGVRVTVKVQLPPFAGKLFGLMGQLLGTVKSLA